MFGMLNAAGINSYIISRENRARRGMAIINRRCFLLELGKALITPRAQQRLSSPFLLRQLKTLITAVLVYFTVCIWSPTVVFVLLLFTSWFISNNTHSFIHMTIWPSLPCLPYTWQFGHPWHASHIHENLAILGMPPIWQFGHPLAILGMPPTWQFGHPLHASHMTIWPSLACLPYPIYIPVALQVAFKGYSGNKGL